VSLTSSSTVPPGWYPDPSGARQWRVWTGSTWSELTRPYGPASAPAAAQATPAVVSSLALIDGLNRLVRYGTLALFTGLGLVVSVFAHWPGTAHPTPLWFAMTALDTGLGLLVIGSACYGWAARLLQGHWSIEALLPGVNVLMVSALVTQRLGGRSPLWRVVSETILLALFVVQSHAEPWLAIAPALVALDHMRWTSSLLDRLVGPPATLTAATS
jgi:hypothetical protein